MTVLSSRSPRWIDRGHGPTSCQNSEPVDAAARRGRRGNWRRHRMSWFTLRQVDHARCNKNESGHRIAVFTRGYRRRDQDRLPWFDRLIDAFTCDNDERQFRSLGPVAGGDDLRSDPARANMPQFTTDHRRGSDHRSPVAELLPRRKWGWDDSRSGLGICQSEDRIPLPGIEVGQLVAELGHRWR